MWFSHVCMFLRFFLFDLFAHPILFSAYIHFCVFLSFLRAEHGSRLWARAPRWLWGSVVLAIYTVFSRLENTHSLYLSIDYTVSTVLYLVPLLHNT